MRHILGMVAMLAAAAMIVGCTVETTPGPVAANPQPASLAGTTYLGTLSAVSGVYTQYYYDTTTSFSGFWVTGMTVDLDPDMWADSLYQGGAANANFYCTAAGGTTDDTCAAYDLVSAGTRLYLTLYGFSGFIGTRYADVYYWQ